MKDREAWHAKIHGVTKSRTWLIHWKQQQQSINDHLQTSEVSHGKLILRSTRAESKSAVYSCTLESPGFSLASSRAKIFLPVLIPDVWIYLKCWVHTLDGQWRELHAIKEEVGWLAPSLPLSSCTSIKGS